MTSFDQEGGALVFTLFDGLWESKVLDGEGTYGGHNRVVFDEANGGRPLVCGSEILAEDQATLSCWAQNSMGFWVKAAVAETGSAKPFEMELAPDGTVYLLYEAADGHLTLASSKLDRGAWDHTPVVEGAGYYALALGPYGLPRVAYQKDDVAWYGAMRSTGLVTEVLDDSSGSPGTGIRLRIGPNHRPQVVYLKNGNLVYGIKLGGQWFSEVADAVKVGSAIGFDLNGWSEPRVSYYDAIHHTLRYAWRNRSGTWRVTQPIAGQDLGDTSALLVDALGRAHIAYHHDSEGSVGYYVEPLWLDYTLPPATDVDDVLNTGVAGAIPGDGACTGSETSGSADAWSTVLGVSDCPDDGACVTDVAIGPDGTIYVGAGDRLVAVANSVPLCSDCAWPKAHKDAQNTSSF